MGESVDVQVTDGVATIRLDRPPMNAISVQVQAELRDAAAVVTSTPEIRAVVVYGGEKVFAAGADVKEMADKQLPGNGSGQPGDAQVVQRGCDDPQAGCCGDHRLRTRWRAGTGAVRGLSGVR